MTDDANTPSPFDDLKLSWRSWVRILWLTLRGLLRHGPPLDHDPAIKPLPARPSQKNIERARCALFAHFVVFMIRHKGQLPDLPESIADFSDLPYGIRFQIQLGLLFDALEHGDGAAYNTALRAIRDGTWESVLPPEIKALQHG